MRFKRLIVFSLLFPLSAVASWTQLHEGWSYQKIATVHLFRLDPAQCRLDLLVATDFRQAALPAKGFREKSQAGLVINGGFFDESFRSLGLLVRQGKVVNPLRQVDWGIFQIRPGVAAIIHRSQWGGEGVETALQAGPRLVIDGKIPSFKAETESHRRSAIGVTSEGKIIIAISEAPIPLRQWAELMQQQSVAALNLDGGGSSQISVKLKDFSLELPGTTGVPNALAVFEK